MIMDRINAIGGYDVNNFRRGFDGVSVERYLAVAAQSLLQAGVDCEFRIGNQVFNMGGGDYEIGTYYGIDVHFSEGIVVIYGAQRGGKYALLIMPCCEISRAVKIFVNYVSVGAVVLDLSVATS